MYILYSSCANICNIRYLFESISFSNKSVIKTNISWLTSMPEIQYCLTLKGIKQTGSVVQVKNTFIFGLEHYIFYIIKNVH